MTFERDKKTVELQKKIVIFSESGAKKGNSFQTVGKIQVAIYRQNISRNTGSAEYDEVTHTALTKEKNLKKNLYRLFDNGTIYEITDCDVTHRLTNLWLKEVDVNV